jgi:polysaccharide chain length determinant protein (PEP-CTERM system associated)
MMARKPPASPQEVWEVFLRRMWWIVVPMVTVPLLFAWIGTRLPKQYQSQGLVMADPQKISADLVKQGGDTAERLETIQEEVVSRPRLEQIARELQLAGGKGSDGGVERAARQMEKNLDITVKKAGGDDSPIIGYQITYTANNPQIAQAVVAKIAGLFIEENASWSSQQAQGTHAFLSDQVAKAKSGLDAQQQKIEEFKAAHLGTLPEQEASNLTLISQYQTMLQANSEAIDRASQQKVYLQSLLDANDAGTKGTPAPAPTLLELQLQKAKDDLAAAREIYTDSFPDVIALKEEVASLEQQVKSQPKGRNPAIATTGPTMMQQLESQLLAVNQEIRDRSQRQTTLEAQLKGLQAQVQVVPEVQSQYEALTQVYNEMEKNYESLLEKQQSAGMVDELQQHHDSGGFQVIDPPALPAGPSGPNLVIVDAAGLACGILLGVTLGVVVDLMDATIHNADDLEKYLDLPMIVSLPNFERELTRRRKDERRRASAVAS